MPATDRALVTRARAGEHVAFARLLERHRPALLGTCRAMLGGGGDAVDVAQEAALVAWLQLDRLRDPDRFGPWLRGIGRTLCLRELRRRGAGREQLTPDGRLPDAAIAEANEPAARALAAERAADLAAGIAALPAGQRDAVVLFHLGDLPQASVAARLATREGAVRTRLHKARAALRARLTTTTTPEDPVPQTALPARIADVRRTPAGRRVVLLATQEGELPIWIGVPEAEALVAGVHDVELPRPSAHALALSLLRASGRGIAGVRIVRLQDAVFYAEVVLDDGSVVDARPSDALVLGVAAGAPLEIDPTVLQAAAAAPPDEYVEDLARPGGDGAATLAGELRERLAEQAAELDRLRRAR